MIAASEPLTGGEEHHASRAPSGLLWTWFARQHGKVPEQAQQAPAENTEHWPPSAQGTTAIASISISQSSCARPATCTRVSAG